jgi:putative flippase GtrA
MNINTQHKHNCAKSGHERAVQFLHFAVMGALGTGIHYAILIVLVSEFNQSASLSAMIGATAGAFANYFLNYHFTFASDRRHREALPRFLAMAALGVAMNGLIVEALTLYKLNYLVAQIIATLVILGINFMVSRTWIFRKLP